MQEKGIGIGVKKLGKPALGLRLVSLLLIFSLLPLPMRAEGSLPPPTQESCTAHISSAPAPPKAASPTAQDPDVPPPRKRRHWGGPVIVGLYLAGLTLIGFGTELVPEKARPLIVAITLLGTNLVNALAARFEHMLTSKAEKMGFSAMVKTENIDPEIANLNHHRWEFGHAMMETIHQTGRNFASFAVQTLLPLMMQARAEILNSKMVERKGADPFDLVAMSLVYLRKTYIDVDPLDPDIVAMAQVIAEIGSISPQEKIARTLAAIPKFDIKHSDPEVMAKYRMILNNWFLPKGKPTKL